MTNPNRDRYEASFNNAMERGQADYENLTPEYEDDEEDAEADDSELEDEE